MTIKEIRNYTGLTQEAFCKLYNIPRSTLEKWESGSRKPPEYLINLLQRAVLEDFSN